MARDAAADAFEAQCGRLSGLAYRMLGSAAEADDAVRDACLRRDSAERDTLTPPPPG
ncbi:hypothetical protein [Streptomyces gossypii]|uniref:hypothetical protein n=1 Tax=Streptomyces gossypii TaxID=2883101 RepID=UPI002882F100|nr:hypothetical protein [Streptomyces gossypii]